MRLVAATYFGPGDHRLSRKAQRALDEVVQLLRSTPYGRIVVAGYADGTGQRGEGARVAARRAASVRAHLVARGIAAERIEQETHSADPLAGSGTACTRRTAKARQACAQARGRTDVRVYGLESAGAAATGGGRVRPQ